MVFSMSQIMSSQADATQPSKPPSVYQLYTAYIVKSLLKTIVSYNAIPPNILWKLFEYAACLWADVVPWDMVPPTDKERDYGVDGVSMDFKTAIQAKYRTNSTLSFTDITTFYTLGAGVLNVTTLHLICSDGCKISGLISKVLFNDTFYNM